MSDCKDNQCNIPNANSGSNCNTAPKQSDDCCTMAEDLLCLAKQAKQDLLKEKMKVAIEAKIGDKLNNVADVAVEAALACFMHKLEGKQACNEYKENLMTALKS